jgi:1-deoxy-D-xylulose-5-phosphate reductoisomerase
VPTAPAKKRIVLLGATGSIGENTLRVIAAHRDRLDLVGIAARCTPTTCSTPCA